MPNGKQFDPVAAAALSALDASQRSVRAVRQDTGAPQPPGENQVAQATRQGINTVSQVSPFNVAARNGLPALPGMQGGQLPNPADLLPGQGGQMNLPDPTDLLPGQGGARQNRSSNGGSSNGGSSTSGGGNAGSRDARQNRSSR